MSRGQIVEGYLARHVELSSPTTRVAKQFLTRSAAEKWSPEAGVSVYPADVAGRHREQGAA